MESKASKYNGIAVALAWPETYCKQANAWYDNPMRWLGFNKDYYYQAGHAAVLLIKKGGDKCHYFDFGRYHAPFGKGRVRSADTDPELDVHTKPEFCFDGKEILNLREILFELQSKYCYHGDGRVYASQFPIEFQKAHQKAIELQNKDFISYGPFIINGTNCSRFVSTVIAAGSPPLINFLRLKLLVPTTPSPLSNVRAGVYSISVPKLSAVGDKIEFFRPNYRNWTSNLDWLSTTFPKPERQSSIPNDAQWLSGEGYGSWFSIEFSDNEIHLTKYSPKGILEHFSTFNSDNQEVDPSKPYRISCPTNNIKLSIEQDGKIYLYSNSYNETKKLLRRSI